MPVQGSGSHESTRNDIAERVTAALNATQFGPVDWVEVTGSTNDDLLAVASRGAPHGQVLVADHQTAGRGRRDRSWADSPGDSLLVSVLLRPPDPGRLSLLTAAFGLAAAEACDALGCPGARLKWPNDLVVGPPGANRKLAGILAQSEVKGAKVAVVVGLGLNRTSEGLGNLSQVAAGLDELGEAPERHELLIRILTNADRLLGDMDLDSEFMWERYRGRSATLGATVRAELDSGTVVGFARDITEEGALMIDVDGKEVEIVAGDVVSVLPGA